MICHVRLVLTVTALTTVQLYSDLAGINVPIFRNKHDNSKRRQMFTRIYNIRSQRTVIYLWNIYFHKF